MYYHHHTAGQPQGNARKTIRFSQSARYKCNNSLFCVCLCVRACVHLCIFAIRFVFHLTPFKTNTIKFIFISCGNCLSCNNLNGKVFQPKLCALIVSTHFCTIHTNYKMTTWTGSTRERKTNIEKKEA